MSGVSRRDLLAAWAVVVAACRTPETAESDTASDADTDPVDTDVPYDPCQFTAGTEAEGWRPLPLSEHPDLAAVGGSVAVTLEGRQLVVGQVSDGCFVAMDRICPHAGCAIVLRSGRFVCPCHGSAFRTDGSVQGGPSPRAVDVFPAAMRDDAVWVQIR